MSMRYTMKLALIAGMLAGMQAHAAVTAEEAAKLKTELTPFGAEKAGNKDGTIPAWNGGYTTPMPGFNNGGRRGDPFANEKPLFSITAANMAQYDDKLTDGTKALLKKYPKTYRVDVYKTHRTAAAPQWVYDNTFKNATKATIENEVVKGAYGGIPFPIPKTGLEIVANNELHWRGEAWQNDQRGYLITPTGQAVLSNEALFDFQMPYYSKSGESKFRGEFWMIRFTNTGPAVRAGEGTVGRNNLDSTKNSTWIYLTGQRRVRKVPNACCDTPAPSSSGVATFDEMEVLQGRVDRFDWKIVGKKEVFIPYNNNGLHTPKKDSDILMAEHMNPEHVRWELHRVWVIEANLKPGQRHMAPKSRYYVDEDTWVAVLGDRWDAKGQLWKTLWTNPVVMPDLPATTPQQQWGFKDLISGAWYVSGVVNERPIQYKIVTPRPDTYFTAEALAGEGVR